MGGRRMEVGGRQVGVGGFGGREMGVGGYLSYAKPAQESGV